MMAARRMPSLRDGAMIVGDGWRMRTKPAAWAFSRTGVLCVAFAIGSPPTQSADDDQP